MGKDTAPRRDENFSETSTRMGQMVDALAETARRFRLGGNQPLELNDPQTVRLVVTGQADIFAIPDQDGGPQGSRLHIGRVGVGNFLLGFSSELNGQGVRFIAVASADTELIELSWQDLRDHSKRLGYGDLFVGLVEAWVQNLCSELSFWGPPPTSMVDVERGESREADPGTSVGLGQGLLWLDHLEGVARFMGQENLRPIAADQPVPLCKHTWVVASEHCVFRCDWTADLLDRTGALERALNQFHSLIGEIVALRREENLSAQTARLTRENDQERRLTAYALELLSSVLTQKKRDSIRPTGEPLFDACQIVCSHMGISARQPVRTLTNKFDPLRQICQASGIRFREAFLEGKWWREDHGPLLAFRANDDTPVAVLDVRPGEYVVRNPADEAQVRVTRDVAASFKPLAYSFQIPFPEKPLFAWDLINFAVPRCNADIWRIVCVSILAGLLSLIAPIATGILFDDIIPSEDRTQLLRLCSAFLVAAVSMTMLQFVQSMALLRMEGKMSWLIQAAMWDRLLSLPATFFRKYASGDLANRSLGLDQMRQLIFGTAIATLVSGIFSIFQVGLMFFYNLELAIVSMIMIVLSLLIPGVCLALQLKYQRPLYDIVGKIQAFNLQVVNGIAKLRISAAEKRIFHIWASWFAKQKDLSFKSGLVGNVLGVVSGSLTLLGTLIIFVWVFMSSDRPLLYMTSGDFLAFLSAFTTVLLSAHSSLNKLYPMMSIKPLYERTRPILEALPEVKRTAADPGELTGHVELSEVSFRYSPGGPLVINNISLEIKPGQFVAFVGPSGSGKSTLLRLLLGFEQSESGAILYDRQDLAQLDVQAVRRQIGVVLQNGSLFAGSIFENIVGSTLLTLDDAWYAASRADLEHDIHNMPMGMNTVIGEGGEGLSGGQRQRLLIARAIVRRPRMIFFDEATSALDNQSQAWVSKSLAELKATRIVIAHRLTTIKDADQICVIVNGEMAEMGGYEYLMAQGGEFWNLAKRQLT